MAASQSARIAGWTVGIILLLLILGALFGLVIIRSGVINIAATEPDPAPLHWVLETASDSSIKRHARDIQAPPLDDPAMIRNGFIQYRNTCQGCHGAPGVEQGDFARGMNPHPPELTEEAEEWEANELFWVTKYGIRMTGMPAWGPVRSDEEIWQIVAFMKQLPGMTPEQYATLDRQNPRARR